MLDVESQWTLEQPLIEQIGFKNTRLVVFLTTKTRNVARQTAIARIWLPQKLFGQLPEPLFMAHWHLSINTINISTVEVKNCKLDRRLPH
jgi:hypothetical protein